VDTAPVPNYPRTKRPVGEGWEKLRVTESDIERLFTSGSNIGLLLGEPSGGLVDGDLDCSEAIAVASILLPATGLIGGRESAPLSHWWYVTDNPPDTASISFEDPTINGSDGKRSKLLELRSTGGQTVIYPSIYPAEPEKGHPKEERCIWHRQGEPSHVPIAELLQAFREVAAASLIGRYWPKGSRNAAALALAGGLLRAWGMELEDVERVETFIRAVCAAAKDDELQNRIVAVRATAERLKTDGSETTGWTSLAKLLGSRGQAIVDRVKEWLSIEIDNSAISAICAWPDPVPLSTIPLVPPFPVEILPHLLRQWSEAVALDLQVPVDLPASLGIGLIAAGAARKYVVQPRDGFIEPVNLFVMALLPPGERKTQTFKRAIAPVQELQREAREQAKPLIQEAESEFRIADKRVKHLEDKIAKQEDDVEKEQLQAELKDAREQLTSVEIPPEPLLYTEDDTPESLKLELVRQGGRMMVATTEAKCLENITLYCEKPNFDVYLKGHAGDEINSGRIKRGRDCITDPALSCLLSPQPAVAQGLAENEILRGRGFLARWLYMLPESKVGRREIAAGAVPKRLQERYASLVRRVWESIYITDEFGNLVPYVLEFTPEADQEFQAFERWIEPQLAPGKRLARLAGWANKLAGACARLAAVFHIADAIGDGKDWKTAIEWG
jgi:hypothetical protein